MIQHVFFELGLGEEGITILTQDSLSGRIAFFLEALDDPLFDLVGELIEVDIFFARRTSSSRKISMR